MDLSRNQLIGIAAIFILLFGVVIMSGCIGQEEELPEKDKIVIGCALSLTGPFGGGAALHLTPYYNWIVDEYNDKGGLYIPEYDKRLPIELKIVDDEGSVENLISQTERFITVDKVDFLFPPWGTAMNFAVFPVYEQHKYPVVALTVGADEASSRIKNGEWNYVFLTLGQPHHTGRIIADYLSHIRENITPLDSVGILFVADQHGVEYGGAAYSHLYTRGFNITVYQSYPINVADFTPLINQLKTWDCDVMFASSYPPDGMLLLGQCIGQDYSPKVMFFGPGIEVPMIVHGPGAFTDEQTRGIHFYDGYPATAYDTTELAEWAELHNTKLGWYPFPASATFYSGIQALFLAIEQEGLNRELVRDALATQTFDTVLGDFTFVPGEHPDIPGTGELSQWQGGNMMEVVWPLDAKSADIIAPKPAWPPPPAGSPMITGTSELSQWQGGNMMQDEIEVEAVLSLDFATMDIMCPTLSWRLTSKD